jgi:hypothetical protein
MFVFFLAGVLLLWLMGASYVLVVNGETGWADLSAVADALGWVWVLVPWREWLTRGPHGSHRLTL